MEIVLSSALEEPPRKKARYSNGTVVVNRFQSDEHGYDTPYRGVIDKYDEKDEYYHVLYQDDDEAEYDENDIKQMIVKSWNINKTIPSIDSSSSTTTTTDEYDLFYIHGIPNDRYKYIRGFNEKEKIAEFFLFISERQRIWERRYRGDTSPYSELITLQQFSWCNIYRELDRGTQFFHSYIVQLWNTKKQKHWTRKEWLRIVLFLSYVYRIINRVESFKITGFPNETKLNIFFNKAKQIIISGKSYFTAAHQTTNFDRMKIYVQQAINDKILDHICNIIYNNATCNKTCLQVLTKLPGVQDFFAWQILCDLHESGCLSFHDDTYCYLGPGAKAGLKIIFSDSDIPPLILAQQLANQHDLIYEALGIHFPYWLDKPLTIKEIEHALCEYAKYHRNKTDEKGKSLRYWQNKNISIMETTTYCNLCRCENNNKQGNGVVKSTWLCNNCIAFQNKQFKS